MILIDIMRRPQPYPDIVHALTPDPEEPPPDLTRSPYLTYATKSGEKPYMHPSDHQKWGKIPIHEVFDLSSGCSERNLPSGLGKTVSGLRPTRSSTNQDLFMKTKSSVFITQSDVKGKEQA